MSEIAALQATDRARALPAGLRAQAIATLMQIPDDVADLVVAEKARALTPRAADGAFALLMGAETAPIAPATPVVVPATSAAAEAGVRKPGPPPAAALDAAGSQRRRRPRPLIMRLLAASMAVAIPAGGLVVTTRLVDSGPKKGPSAVGPGIAGPVYERDAFEHGRRELTPPAAEPQRPSIAEPRTPRRSIAKTAVKGTRIQRSFPKRQPRPPATPPKDVVQVVADVVNTATGLVCEVAGTATGLLAPGAGSSCPTSEKSLPLLGLSG